MNSIAEKMRSARERGFCIPAFNIPYLPMVKPVVQAVAAEGCFALVEVARPEWEKFESQSLEAVKEEYDRWRDPAHAALHLDHIPVIDEDDKRVDFLHFIERAIACGYDSVMVDGSRLSLEDNIQATRSVVERAHQAGIPCEAELGAVLGHEEGPLPPYDELFRTKRGFTSPEEAHEFAEKTGCDWLSIAFGNVHGAISASKRSETKIEARLDIEHLRNLAGATGIPLVLHGGSGIRSSDVREAFKNGICKMNIGTEIRQVYEASLNSSNDVEAARESVYSRVRYILSETLQLSGSEKTL